jgi:hypothetical protein
MFSRNFGNPTGYLRVEGISPSGTRFWENRQILGDPQTTLDRIRATQIPDETARRDPTPGATTGTPKPPIFGDNAEPTVKSADQFFGGVRIFDAKTEGITGIKVESSGRPTLRQPPTPNTKIAAQLQAEDNNQTIIKTPQQKAVLGIGAAAIVAWLFGLF